jgi:hypothetical protein
MQKSSLPDSGPVSGFDCKRLAINDLAANWFRTQTARKFVRKFPATVFLVPRFLVSRFFFEITLQPFTRRCGEMADATDLKSVGL